MDIRPVPPQSPDARRLLGEYLDDCCAAWATAGRGRATSTRRPTSSCRRRGCAATRLDSTEQLAEAMALYRSAGYVYR